MVPRFRNDAGIIVQPTLRNMEACAAAAPVDADRGTFHLHRSAAGGCYPVCEVLYLNMKKSKCLETNDFETAEKRAVEFVEWVFRSPQVKALLAQHHIVLLHTASEAAQAYNKWILNGVSCNPRFMLSTASLVLIYVGIGLMLVLLAAALLCMWRSTATVRELRKKFSNENMALACVDAMASLDFDRLEWLHSLSDPSPTQVPRAPRARARPAPRDLCQGGPRRFLNLLQRVGHPRAVSCQLLPVAGQVPR